MWQYGLHVQAEENRKTRRAAVKARKAMVPDDQVDGDSSDSSEDSDESPDVHISTSDEEGTENGDAEEVKHCCWLRCDVL